MESQKKRGRSHAHDYTQAGAAQPNESCQICSCNKDIAKKHHTSQRTIERRLSRIFTKLHVSSRVEAVEKAKQLGFIPELHMLLTSSSDR
ncbi:LuxR C-terminal-related transcriptional regulator [Geobacillus zalihae]|uniref:response regulator transcription factor n=1 Tax=Geobacillus sp. PK12 TaxID=2508525 RepID=UPI001CC1C4C8|nr:MULTISPECIES: LuxR C-terminal-related transcriptional regulator [Geobacillus]WKA47817.1 LuxR C-terminal-related transcriptional regulator [Geobacillus zalihae]